jgi:hypothetical protein
VTPEQAAMVDFLRQRYAEGIDRAREIGNMLITRGAPQMGISSQLAEQRARDSLHAAETRAQFFEDTVLPYLGTAGPTGRIADQQLHLLAWEHGSHRDHQETWRP